MDLHAPGQRQRGDRAPCHAASVFAARTTPIWWSVQC